MKLNKIIICTIIFLIGILVFSIKIEANSETFQVNYSEEFLRWINLGEDEKENTIMPDMYTIELPENCKEIEVQKEKNWFSKLWDLLSSKKDSSQDIYKSRYVLNDYIDIEVKNQGNTYACWAFSILSSMETNMAKNRNITKNFSEKHMTYATSRNFIDGINEKGFNRNFSMGGTHEVGLAYLTNGQGAVIDSLMPFEDIEDPIYLNEIDLPTDSYVTGYEKLPSVYKRFEYDGKITYSDGMGNNYDEETLEQVRYNIKEAIVKHSGISAVMYATGLKYYNSDNLLEATAYFCNDNNAIRDHGITIVGWDDNYSRNNFNENNRPSSDGAYIVLNSYGNEFFDNGYIYISYEDILIENSLYVITQTSEEEYENLYQHDFFGATAYLGSPELETGYYSNTYTRNTAEDEVLDYVGVTIPDYVRLNIYVNPIGDSLYQEDLIKVAQTDVLNPGYHKIKIDEVKLTSEKFSIVVEQISDYNRFYFSVEANTPSTIFDVASSEDGNSKISLDGVHWYDLTFLQVDQNIINMEESDICIKGFTKLDNREEEKYFKSDKYKIGEKYITNIEDNTTIEEFLESITTNEYVIFEEQDDNLIKTGMKLGVGDNVYTLVVTGDVSADGKISLLDISKLILHHNEDILLKNEFKEAGDLNFDGKISLLDISKLILIFNEI